MPRHAAGTLCPTTSCSTKQQLLFSMCHPSPPLLRTSPPPYVPPNTSLPLPTSPPPLPRPSPPLSAPPPPLLEETLPAQRSPAPTINAPHRTASYRCPTRSCCFLASGRVLRDGPSCLEPAGGTLPAIRAIIKANLEKRSSKKIEASCVYPSFTRACVKTIVKTGHF